MAKLDLRLTLTLTLLAMTSLGSALADSHGGEGGGEGEMEMEVIDLTYDVGSDSIYWPIYPPVNLNILQRGILEDAGIYMEYNTFGMAEHTGTHSDAPAHFVPGGWKASMVPASRLVGPGVVIDVSYKVAEDVLYMTTVQDILDWEAANGRVPEKGVVFIHSGWGDRYPNKTLVFNSATGNDTDPSTFRFPTMTGEAARFLAENRSLIAVGFDVPGPDLNIPAHPAHVAFLQNDVLILENVANIRRLPPKGSTVIIGMIKLYDGSGGPSRVLAVKNMMQTGCNCHDDTGAATRHPAMASFILLTSVFVAVVLGVI